MELKTKIILGSIIILCLLCIVLITYFLAIKPANEDPPIDGYYTEYIKVGDCMSGGSNSVPIKCGVGTQHVKSTYVPPKRGGKEPSYQAMEKDEICQLADCVPINGTYTNYKNIGTCIKSQTDNTAITCGSGVQEQSRTYIPATYGGTEIAPNDQELTNWSICNLAACPTKVDAICTPWVDDSAGCICDLNGQYSLLQTRTYTPPMAGGADNTGDCKTSRSQTILCDSNISSSPLGSTPGAKCPAVSKLTEYSQPNPASCTPAQGQNRKQNLIATYTYPIGDMAHSAYIKNGFGDNIAEIQALTIGQSKQYTHAIDGTLVTFQRTNSSTPEQYKLTKVANCDDIPFYSPDTLQSLWVNKTGCTNPLTNALTPLSKTILDLQYIENTADIQKLFGRFSKLGNPDNKGLLYNYSIDDIRTCYKKDTYLTISKNDLYGTDGNVLPGVQIPKSLPTGIKISNKDGDITFLKNNGYTLRLQKDGNLILSDNKNYGLWTSGTYTQSIISLTFQLDGYLTMQNLSGTVWTANKNGIQDTYLYLDSNGYLSIKNDSGDIYVIYPDDNVLKLLWKQNTECTNSLTNIFPDLSKSIKALTNINNDIITKAIFSMFSKRGIADSNNGLMNGYNSKNINICYNNDYLSISHVDQFIGGSNNLLPGVSIPYILPVGVTFNNSNGDVLILANGDNKLWFTQSGNLVIVNSGNAIWNSDTSRLGAITLTMQRDGNLTMRSSSSQVWATDTYTNPDAYLLLKSDAHTTDFGQIPGPFLMIAKLSGAPYLKCLYPSEENYIKTYLSNQFYNNSPMALFTDYVGKVWKANWDIFQTDFDTNSIVSKGGDNTYNFTGLNYNDTDQTWFVTQRDLNNITGYNNELTTDKPINFDDGNNWYSKNDESVFFKNRSSYIKPAQMAGGGRMTNYIPGYQRISDVVSPGTDQKNATKFLIMFRPDRNKLAFVLYKKRSPSDFANDIYINNPDLVQQIRTKMYNKII